MNFNARATFCKDWPTAKAVLSLMKAAGSIWVRIGCSILIAAGDALHKELCSDEANKS